jgi:hypothetical protein
MSTNRRGESGPVPFRRGRFYSIDHQWYATTREGDELGPYASDEDAQMGVAAYLVDYLSDEEVESLAVISTNDPVDLSISEIRRFKEKLAEAGVKAAIAWARSRVDRLMGEDLPVRQRQTRVHALQFMLEQY